MATNLGSARSFGVALRTRIIGIFSLAIGLFTLYSQSAGIKMGIGILDLFMNVLSIFFIIAGVVMLFYQAKLTIDDDQISYTQFGQKKSAAWKEIDSAVITASDNDVGMKIKTLRECFKRESARVK